VVGTLATETRNATYVGLSATDVSMMAGVANVLDSDFMAAKALKGPQIAMPASIRVPEHGQVLCALLYEGLRRPEGRA